MIVVSFFRSGDADDFDERGIAILTLRGMAVGILGGPVDGFEYLSDERTNPTTLAMISLLLCIESSNSECAIVKLLVTMLRITMAVTEMVRTIGGCLSIWYWRR